MSASELHRRIGNAVPISSLYRSLSVMEDAGVLVHHFGKGGVTRYELAEWLQGHHHHLICVVCGRVEDLQLPAGYEDRIQVLVDQIARLTSFSPVDHALEIDGKCMECA